MASGGSGGGSGHQKNQKSSARKQAIVVIHGMGEQRPMETMRQFVKAVWHGDDGSKDDEGSKTTWVTPDIGDGNTELMRITTDWHECHLPDNNKGGNKKPETVPLGRTDFFEFYWADVLADSRLSMLTPWVRSLYFRLPNNVPSSVMGLWVMMWLIMAVMVVGFGQAVSAAFSSTALHSLSWSNFILYAAGHAIRYPATADNLVKIEAVIVGVLLITMALSIGRGVKHNQVKAGIIEAIRRAAIIIVLSVIILAFAKYLLMAYRSFSPDYRNLAITLPLNIVFSVIILSLLNTFIIPYFGDVARYLHTSPNTVGKREEIRKRGLELLRRLHNDDSYERIVIVAHSLGTVIAYDLIRILWSEYGPLSSNAPLTKSQIASFQHVAEMATQFQETIALDSSKPWQREKILKFRNAQKQAFLALQQSNTKSGGIDGPKRWKISDFVTCGSPLTHARFLVAPTEKQLKSLIDERTLPICPPILEDGDNRYGAASGNPTYLYETRRDDQPLAFAHHGAPFAVVRWSNAYDWRSFGLFGDFVSGPLRQIFGAGIADFHIRLYRGLGGWLSRYVTHTLYWKNNGVSSRMAGQRTSKEQDKIPHHIELLRAAVDMRFGDDQLSGFEPGEPVSHPLAAALNAIIWCVIGLALAVPFAAAVLYIS